MLNTLLRRFDIRTRMWGAIAMVMGLLALLGGTGLWSLSRMAGLSEQFARTTHAEALQLGELRTELGNVRRYEKDLIINYEKADQIAAYKAKWLAAVDAVQQHARTLADGSDSAVAQHAKQCATLMKTYVEKAMPVVRQLEASGYDSATVANKLLGPAKEAIDGAETEVAALTQRLAEQAMASDAARAATAATARWLFIGALLLSIALVVPLTLANMVSICRPIESAQSLANRIATGDLTQTIDDQGRDESARLLQSLAHMQQSLRGIVSQVRESAHSIQNASSEVASGNQDLSVRTEQAASNLQQTASSMEEITGTLRQSSESAAQANQLASSASTVAERGGAAVAQVVQTMNDIAASSQRIAEIIGTIDGIAFQTNILALNAAVEAARAGEQGRGFAVVAGEVRALAQRSAEAAREIKALISASVERVDTGAALVRNAGATMTDIVAGVQRVSQVIGAITQAADQQNQGIGEINSAVAQLDRMTQENAALVEQAAAAAESLKQQSLRLTETVAGFRLAA
ncbi:MAG: MCP four helix bundle domain-containing protein [Burkholderiaceae bacterium]|nr:MCP four helix bundle domain-containing protein [Burkholderiaceae bacterium]